MFCFIYSNKILNGVGFTVFLRCEIVREPVCARAFLCFLNRMNGVMEGFTHCENYFRFLLRCPLLRTINIILVSWSCSFILSMTSCSRFSFTCHATCNQIQPSFFDFIYYSVHLNFIAFFRANAMIFPMTKSHFFFLSFFVSIRFVLLKSCQPTDIPDHIWAQYKILFTRNLQ